MTVIVSGELNLRPVREADAPDFARLCNDVSIARNASRMPSPYTLDNALAFTRHLAEASAAGEEHAFAVCRNEKIISCCGLMRDGNAWELGYWVGADARGQGIATRAANAVLQFAFDKLATDKVTAGHFVDNPISGRVLNKLGFQKTGEVVRTYSLGRGEEVDTVRFVLNRDVFRPAEKVRYTD